MIIGHSERRRLFGETDATREPQDRRRPSPPGLTPIVCVGETLEERERNETLAVLDRQIKDGLDGLTRGAGRRARRRLRAGLGDRHRAERDRRAGQEAHPHIRTRLRQWFGADAADRCHVHLRRQRQAGQYRASSSREPDVDGALVGGASLDVKSFAEIVTRSRPAAV